MMRAKKELKPHQSSFLLLLTVFLVTVGIIFFYLYPTWQKIQDWQKETRANNQTLQNEIQPKLNLLRSLDEAKLDQAIQALEEALPSYPYEALVMQELEELAAESSVELGALKATANEAANIVTTPLLIKGDKEEIITFIKNLERAKRVLSLEDLTLAREEDRFVLQAKVVAPYQPVPQNLGDLTSKLQALDARDQEVLAQVARLNSYVSTESAASPTPLPSTGRDNPFRP